MAGSIRRATVVLELVRESRFPNKLLIFLLLAWVNPGPQGQAGKAPSDLQAYVDSVFTALIPALDQQKDFAGIFRHLDAAFRIKNDGKAWVEAFDILGWKLHYAGLYNRFDAYCETLGQADQFLQEHAGDFDPKTLEENRSDIQLRSAYYFYETGNWLSATENYRQIREELSGLPQKDSADWFNLASSNLYLGVMARSKGDYEAAEAYFLEALDCQKEYRNALEQSRGNALIHKHLGDLFLLQKDYVRSEEYYEKAVGSYEQLAGRERDPYLIKRNRNGITTSLLGLAKLQQTNLRYDQALVSLERAQKIGSLSDEVHHGLGEVYAASRDFEKARLHFDQALQLRQQTFGLKHYKTAQTLASLGDLRMTLNDPREALQFYQQSLVALSDDFNETDVAKNPTSFQTTFISRDLPGVFAKKMDALLQLYEINRSDRNYLTLAHHTGQDAMAVLDSLKSSPVKSDEDKHRLLAESYAVYEKNLHVAVELGPDHYDEAFAVMEKSKSIVLFEAFQNANARHLAGIPDTLLEKEFRLKHELHLLEDLLRKAGGDDRTRDAMKLRIAALKTDYRRLIDAFKRNSPRYYQLKYAPVALTIEQVRENLLEDDQAMLEYFVGDSSIFVLVVTNDKLELKEIKKSFPLDEWVGDLLEGVYAGNPAQRSSLSYEQGSEQYARHAWMIYRNILAPVADGLPEKLLIIPDGALGYVPFDALLTAEVPQDFTRFKDHPYLMRGHEISYCYSAALLGEMKKMETGTEGVLAMAPVFKNVGGAGRMRGNTVVLDSLAHNQAEAEAVLEAVGRGEARLGERATKQDFLRLASNFSILHIATHGILNPGQSYFSFLAFTPTADSADSYQLYVRDFYNLRLNAAMAVLSACKTGLGEMKRGEGIISLAYGVFYSGCQSVVMTLWSVDETSTTQIMKNFYTNLSDGYMTKSAALRAAKQSYLRDQTDDFRQHPFFWAAFAPVGDMRALFHANYWLWLLAGGAAAGIWWWIDRKRKQS